MWDLVERNDHLDGNLREQLYCLLLAHDDLFARDKTDFGSTQKILHAINTRDATPIRQHLRRIAPDRRKESQKLLQDMLKKDVIKPSTSLWFLCAVHGWVVAFLHRLPQGECCYTEGRLPTTMSR